MIHITETSTVTLITSLEEIIPEQKPIVRLSEDNYLFEKLSFVVVRDAVIEVASA